MKNVLSKVVSISSAAGLAAASTGALATGPDFTTLTTSVDVTSMIAAVMGVAATMVGFYLAWRGAKFVLRAMKTF